MDWYTLLEDLNESLRYRNAPAKVVVRDESIQKFSLINVNQLEELIKIRPNLHEVIPNANQKLKFDIDAPREKLEPYIRYTGLTYEEVVDTLFKSIMSFIKNIFYKLYLFKLKKINILVFDSSDASKFSRHIVLRHFVSNVDQAQHFNKLLIERLNWWIVEFYDTGVNKRNQCFRMPNCKKVGSERVKKLILPYGEDVKYEEQLISYNPFPEFKLPDRAILKKVPKQDFEAQFDDRIVFQVKKKFGESVVSFENTKWNSHFFRIVAQGEIYCPCCKRDHGSKNFPYAFIFDSKCILKCQRDKSKNIILTTFENEEKFVNHKKRMPQPFDWSYSPKIHAENIKLLMSKQQNNWTFRSYNDKYVKKFVSANTILIKAQMACGKTFQLAKYLKKLLSKCKTLSILLITHRINQAVDVFNRFAEIGFSIYNELPGIIKQDRVICELESLKRIDTMKKYDIVVVDEIESILSQLDSRTMCHDSRAMFDSLFIYSPQLICLDANMNKMYDMVHLRKGTVSSDINIFTRETMVHVYENPAMLTMHAMSRLAKGEPCAFAVTKKKKYGDMLYKKIKTLFPNKNILYYSSDTPDSVKKRDFKDVNQSWKDADVLIYTPTVSTGISFEVKDHFKNFFGYFDNHKLTFNNCTQMMGRIRDLSSYDIYIGKLRGSGPTQPEEVESIMSDLRINLNKKLDLYYRNNPVLKRREFVKDVWYHAHILNVCELNRCLKDYFSGFLQHLVENGSRIQLVESLKTCSEKLARRQDKMFMGLAEDCRNKAISNADISKINLDRDAPVEIIDDPLVKQKVFIMKLYDLSEKKVTPEIVGILEKKADTFINLNRYISGYEIDKEICQVDESIMLKNDYAIRALRLLGFKAPRWGKVGFEMFSNTILSRKQFETGKAKLDILPMQKISLLFKKQRVFKGKPSQTTIKYILEFWNPIWQLLFDIKVKSDGMQTSDSFSLENSEIFKYSKKHKKITTQT
jgi:hypothetical protein